jgi:hypothetical protein
LPSGNVDFHQIGGDNLGLRRGGLEMELLLLGARLLLGVVFLSASIPKLFAPRDFRRALTNYQLLPIWLVAPVATWLPRFELLIAVALLTGVAITITATIAGLALLAFSIAVGVNLARGRQIECGCFGAVSPRRITWWLVLRNLLFAGAAVVLAVNPPGTWTTLGWPFSTSATAATSDAVAILLAALAALVLEQLITEGARVSALLSSAASAFAGDASQ